VNRVTQLFGRTPVTPKMPGAVSVRPSIVANPYGNALRDDLSKVRGSIASISKTQPASPPLTSAQRLRTHYFDGLDEGEQINVEVIMAHTYPQSLGLSWKPVGAAGGYDGGECGLCNTTLSPPSSLSESPQELGAVPVDEVDHAELVGLGVRAWLVGDGVDAALVFFRQTTILIVGRVPDFTQARDVVVHAFNGVFMHQPFGGDHGFLGADRPHGEYDHVVAHAVVPGVRQVQDAHRTQVRILDTAHELLAALFA
nr:hypothetical protein [Tanacetum cinerariifolium]